MQQLLWFVSLLSRLIPVVSKVVLLVSVLSSHTGSILHGGWYDDVCDENSIFIRAKTEAADCSQIFFDTGFQVPPTPARQFHCKSKSIIFVLMQGFKRVRRRPVLPNQSAVLLHFFYSLYGCFWA